MISPKRLAASIFVALIPLIVLSIVLAITHQATIFDKHPSFSDEIVHWAQPAAFRDAGLNSGYFSANEKLPRLSMFHFYSWGPASPAFYGTIAHFIPWKLYTPLLVNLGLLAIGVVIFIQTARLNWRQIGLLALLMLTYPPLILYSPMIMLEILSHAFAVILAILFAWLISQERVTGRQVALVVAVICLVSTIRVTWSVLLLPVFAIHVIEKPTRRRAILEFGLALILIAALFLLYLNWSSSYPNVRNAAFERLSSNPFESLLGMIGNMQRNIRMLFEGNAAQLVMRVQLMTMVVWAVLTARKGGLPKPDLRLAILFVGGLLSIFMFEIVGHEVAAWRDYRVFAPFVMVGMLLLLARNRQRLFGALIAISLISYIAVVPEYLTTLNDFDKANDYSSRIETHEALFHDLGVRFDPNAPSPWCNTVFYSVNYFLDPAVLLAFDDAMGLTLLNDVILLPDTVRSRYILFDAPSVTALGDRIHLRLLTELPQGNLYENLDAGCGQAS